MAPSFQLGEKGTEPVGVFVIDGDWAHSGNHVAKGEISHPGPKRLVRP